jgi:hypothetical protein
MAEVVTLELSEDLVRRAKDMAHDTGRSLESVLTEWLERGSAVQAIALLMPGAVYHIYTPFGGEATAQGLLDLLKAEEAAGKRTK